LDEYLRAPTNEARPYPWPYYPIIQVLDSIFLSFVLGVTVAVKRSIDWYRDTFRRPTRIPIYPTSCGSEIHVHIFFDAILLEGVTTWITEVSNKVKFFCLLTPWNHLYFLCVVFTNCSFTYWATYLYALNMPEIHISTMKKLYSQIM